MTDLTKRGELVNKLFKVCQENKEILEDTVIDYVQRLEENEISDLQEFLTEHFDEVHPLNVSYDEVKKYYD